MRSNLAIAGILLPMPDSFAKEAFSGFGPDGRTYDWKSWDGAPRGHEGFLADGRLTLLAAVTRDERS